MTLKMPFTFLWTDACFLSLLLLGSICLINSLRLKPVREKYRALLTRVGGLCSGIILVFFLVIAVLDSIHIKIKIEPTKTTSFSQSITLLDKLLLPLGAIQEKTYSEPMALTLFNKEIVFKDGRVVQTYPRLQYTKIFNTEQEKNNFINKNLKRSFLISFFTVFTLALLVRIHYIFLNKKENKYQDKNPVANWGYVTLFVALFFIITTYMLSRNLHIFGTGKIGQDIFYHAVKSIRTGLIIGTLTTCFLLPLALLFGISAGYFGGIVDDIIQYIYTTLSSIPGVLLITASILSMQTYIANHPAQFPTLEKAADARLFALCLILGVTSWTSLCRLLRAEALKLREIDFVLAAHSLGSSTRYIFQKHLLPNVMPIVVITLVLDFSFLILAEAVLSYVGVGVSPMTISWGNMINGARLELAADPMIWWPMCAAFVFMFVLVLASNVFADTIRDVFEP